MPTWRPTRSSPSINSAEPPPSIAPATSGATKPYFAVLRWATLSVWKRFTSSSGARVRSMSRYWPTAVWRQMAIRYCVARVELGSPEASITSTARA